MCLNMVKVAQMFLACPMEILLHGAKGQSTQNPNPCVPFAFLVMLMYLSRLISPNVPCIVILSHVVLFYKKKMRLSFKKKNAAQACLTTFVLMPGPCFFLMSCRALLFVVPQADSLWCHLYHPHFCLFVSYPYPYPYPQPKVKDFNRALIQFLNPSFLVGPCISISR